MSKNLYQKIAEVILDIGAQTPEGFNDFHRYKYFTEEQVSTMFRERLASRNIIIVPQVLEHEVRDYQTDKQKHSFLTTMKIMWEVIDGDSGEQFAAVTVGQGDDPGDKGANKAMTGAFKYFLLKLGLVGGESDAEADTATDRRSHDAPMRVGPSNIQGVQRGGRSKNATEAQVKRIRILAKELDLNPYGVAIIIKEVLDQDVDLGSEDPGPPLVEFLGSLGAEDIGKIIQKMVEMKAIDQPEASMGPPDSDYTG